MNPRDIEQSKRDYIQTGGAASAWRHSAHFRYVQPDKITQLTLKDIDKAPMFNPLQEGTRIPMGYVSTGIVPEGIYYMNKAAKLHCRHIEGCGGQEPAKVVRNTSRDSLIQELKKAMQ